MALRKRTADPLQSFLRCRVMVHPIYALLYYVHLPFLITVERTFAVYSPAERFYNHSTAIAADFPALPLKYASSLARTPSSRTCQESLSDPA